MTASRRRVAAALMMVCLALAATPLVSHAPIAQAPQVRVVPTQTCTCAGDSPATAPGTLQYRRLQGTAVPTYDQQIGTTFTQSFTSLEYNITAVEQTDPTTGDGPVYLLNGLSNSGYWYQIGFSWNWEPGENPGTGFAVNYEVFNPSGNSVFPTDGSGGIQSFTGPVKDGDTILLNLYFDSSARTVVMVAEDTDTKASATLSYPSMGASSFVGLPGSIANVNGFFTGLMTEWYHGVPYYADEAEAIYSNPESALSSGWIWTDEFNVNSFQSVFSANTPGPLSYANPNMLQEFSYNGTTAYGDAYEFITGALTNSTQQSSSVPLTLSFSVEGGGSGYSAPTITYISDGTTHTVALTGSPTVYIADLGTDWSVSARLGGSTANFRWETNQTTTAVANSSETIAFVYRYQIYVTFGFSVAGGGSGYSAPTVTYAYFQAPASTPVGAGVWADAGSTYEYTNPLPGSNATERWFAVPVGTLGSSSEVEVVYYHQYLATFDLSFKDTDVFPGIPLKSTSAGQPYSATVILGTNREWLDAGASYSVVATYSLESGERVAANGNSTGVVSPNLDVPLVYQEQFYVSTTENVSGAGVVSPKSGWYDSGSTLQLVATPATGWQFESWGGVGSDSASGTSASLSLVVGPATPANETAVFYPGVVIDASGPVSVSYVDGSVSGNVPGGKTAQVFVPPASTISLTASNAGLLTTFGGWSGASNSSGTSISLSVEAPATITSNSGYNYGEIGAVVLAISLVAASLVLLRSRKGGVPAEQPPPGSSSGAESEAL